jgi:hypothetical protein
MVITTPTLLWLFPIAFMLHDFEELIGFEPWLKRNAGDVKAKLEPRLPAFLTKQIDTILGKTGAEFAVPVLLIFLLTAVSSFIAVEYHSYSFFLAASACFVLHGLMHIGQAIVLRRYVPALATSLLIVLPYGVVLYERLFSEGIARWPGILAYAALGFVAIVPLILVMHWVGEIFAKVGAYGHTPQRGNRP